MTEKTRYERGHTLTYPTMYPVLKITPVFAHDGDFMWVEKVACRWDSEVEPDAPEFEFIRATDRYERCDRLADENAKLRELVSDMYDWMGNALYDGSARKYEYEDLERRMRELGVEP